MSSYGAESDHPHGSYSVVESFPDAYDYGPGEEEGALGSIGSESKPRIVLMGLRRSGKSSISKVVFHKLSPNETLFLESTSKVVKDDISNSSFVQFQIWDFPGQIDFFDPAFDSDHIFGGCGALIFVIDAQVCPVSSQFRDRDVMCPVGRLSRCSSEASPDSDTGLSGEPEYQIRGFHPQS
jgi:Ras-related GTP-binding protein C/D